MAKPSQKAANGISMVPSIGFFLKNDGGIAEKKTCAHTNAFHLRYFFQLFLNVYVINISYI